MPYLAVCGIEVLKAWKKGYKVTVDRDLYFRVSTDGTKTWLVRYVVDNRQKQATLPRRYSSDGDTVHMSLAWIRRMIRRTHQSSDRTTPVTARA